MYFSSAAALVALSSLSVTYAAPFANPQEEIVRRKVNYQVVNVDGESTSSAAPEIETVTKTVKSVTTAPGIAPLPVTVTVTATPSSTPIPSSTPHSHGAPPPGASFFPPPNAGSGFLRRGLMAAGDPLQFARSYDSSTASVTATPLAARGWYFSAVATPTSAIITPSLVARHFGDSVPFSVATPSSSMSPSSLAARQLAGWTLSVSLPATPSSTALASATPIVAREFHDSSSSSVAASYTPLAAREFHGLYYPSASSSATPSSSFTLSPSANALLY